MNVAHVFRPWYVFRPRQIVRRLWSAVRPPTAPCAVTLPWGAMMEVDPRELVGGALWRNGVYDLAASEAAWRLAPVGGLAVDVGANIGCMTTLLAARVGTGGRVIAVEPHPRVRDALERNVARLRARGDAAAVEVVAAALGDREGEGTLAADERFAWNRGVARLVDAAPPDAEAFVVPVRRLDDLLPEGTQVGLLKVDVEGREESVLAGAARLLAEGAIRHVLYEDLAAGTGPTHALLQRSGYTIFALGWRLRGLVLADAGARPFAGDDPPNFVATRAPDELRARLTPSGWRVLRG